MRAGDESPMYGDERSPDHRDQPTMELHSIASHRDAYAPWWRRRSVVAVGASFLAVLVIGTVAFAALRPEPVPLTVGPGPTGTSSPTPSATASPTPTPTPTPSPTPSPTRPPTTPPSTRYVPPDPVVPIPTEKPETDLPPAPPPPPPCVPTYPGPDAPASEVRAALAAAGAHEWWPGVWPEPEGWPPGEPYPAITVPADIMYAVAFTESTWRSSALGCVDEIGLMQLRPDTASWMNGRFGETSDIHSVQGNAELGAMYLQWLTMYFGLYYFGSFNLDTVEPVGDGGANVRLRDVVIAAYNVGVGYSGVENENDPGTEADDTISIRGQGLQYLNTVLSNLTSRPWEGL